jgi:hypothetical protein
MDVSTRPLSAFSQEPMAFSPEGYLSGSAAVETAGEEIAAAHAD